MCIANTGSYHCYKGWKSHIFSVLSSFSSLFSCISCLEHYDLIAMVQLETVILLQTVLVIKSNYYCVECFAGFE